MNNRRLFQQCLLHESQSPRRHNAGIGCCQFVRSGHAMHALAAVIITPMYTDAVEALKQYHQAQPQVSPVPILSVCALLLSIAFKQLQTVNT